ncbi:cyanocobalamin reductase / alkylcobalamin dealkylase isoform X2 [Pangasianodon hypophthalmus]|uniref:cyanocobalamin reductase / alkylcobalamin dealkylase isoform X2 n=1 Tax=Pangasianodon hypophthalmus TaxID=310915 RepID=UPI0023077E5F|nr:cyanocobalamin reductase / alkylcobalamin dealkylase isoform X2 [Pangasianodon hypophthalmus]
MATSCDTVVNVIVQPLRETLNSLGFEVYPLKIGWYNAVVSQAHQLQYSADTLALVVLSTPSMFEKVFLPFLRTGCCKGVRDPVDQCVAQTIKSCVSKCLPDQSVDITFDYELLPNRKPKFLAQTAAHVAGAARYYQPSDIQDPPWGNKHDDAPVHKASSMKTWCVKVGVEELECPAQSPDLNPTEHLWDELEHRLNPRPPHQHQRCLEFASILGWGAGSLSGLCWC